MLTTRLKAARKSARLTQEGLAKRVNTTKATISNYENGHSTPSNDMLLALADALDVSTDYLLGRTDNPQSINYNKNDSKDYPSWGDEAEFEAWVNDPSVYKLYKEMKESSEERKKALLAVWEVLKTQGK
ncbi:transcriptional regulator with XRE-family HTH domain [Planomicrobium stackebrandtii]|uniref:Transcriptional regulator with XRE-family HTH domain n=1 Tax=Planomicrobium stackebrandtii TaxID=253160 RepID=A0ABU0GQT9_9BACL|nr:helix-turn-helix transcriptional regulator [Planomicrobium stackebrandtii]MDQ0427721.1 transcriptional regulator with XRE-family HTH domain [Planomicrobium stackebrandtii]